jgi:hypothetical protein
MSTGATPGTGSACAGAWPASESKSLRLRADVGRIRRLASCRRRSHSTAREFATHFYDNVDLSVRAPGQHAKAFEVVCNEMSDVISEGDEWPCLLQAKETPGVQIWNGRDRELVTSW